MKYRFCIYFFICWTLLTACDDSYCDHGFDDRMLDINYLVGSWYEETQNEEIRYSATGKLDGFYSNEELYGTGSGMYIFDSEKQKITWNWEGNNDGKFRYQYWKLTDIKDYSFTMYSDIAKVSYGKILESYTLKVGDTVSIPTSTLINGQRHIAYSSQNNRIASVSDDGIITAEGEKGTTYIKLTIDDTDKAWVKVIVGEEVLDLWYDYSLLLGKTRSEIIQILGVPSQTSEFMISYYLKLHGMIDNVSIYCDSVTMCADQIKIVVKDSSNFSQVVSYMEQKYYKVRGWGDSYSTNEKLEDSRSIFYLQKQDNIYSIYFEDPTPYNNVLDFRYLFGRDNATVRNFYKETYGYDPWVYNAKLQQYKYPEHPNINHVYFHFSNYGKYVMTSYDIYLKHNDKSRVVESLKKVYPDLYYFEEESSDSQIVFYDNASKVNATIRIVYNGNISVSDVLHNDSIWPNFESLLGENDNTVNRKMLDWGYSYRYTKQDYSLNGSDYYAPNNNDYLFLIGFVFNSDLHASEFWIYLKEPSIQVLTYLMDNYTLEGVVDETKYVLYNKDRNIRIEYDSIEGVVVFIDESEKPYTPAS